MTIFRIQYYAKYQSDNQLGGSFTFILFFFSFGVPFLMIKYLKGLKMKQYFC